MENKTLKPLAGKIAVVAGATRGAGRGIAVMLGAAGATVYCTGRSVRGGASDINRSETIDDTAEMVTARGGIGIPIRCDHTEEEEVKALFERIAKEQEGRLDLLVNDIWGGEQLTHWGTPFWEQPLGDALLMQERAIKTHLITSYYGAPLMIKRGEGLIIEVTDGSTYNYRGNLYYSLAKISPIHLAAAMAESCARIILPPSRLHRDSCGPNKCWIILEWEKITGGMRLPRNRITLNRKRLTLSAKPWLPLPVILMSMKSPAVH